MCPALFSRRQVGALCLVLAPLAAAGCSGSGGTDIVLPSLSVSTSTSGVELDPDGYTFAVDGQPAQAIGVQATVTVDRLADGQHSVELAGVAPNCAVAGENPRTVSVTSTATAAAAFTISCSAGTGGVRIVTATSGTGTDPDGYTLLLDGTDRGPIGLSATATLGGIPTGSHTVGLAGLAANCQAAGENPRPVAVASSATAEVGFAVTCTAPGPITGSLEIRVATSGTNQDPDGYQLSVDGGASQPVGTNATVTLANVPAAQHTVRLLGLSANCAVTGDNPIGAVVAAGETASVAFTVTCVATTGELRITISGLPGGAQAAVTVTGPNSFSRPLAETQTLTGLVPGDYTVGASSVTSGGTTYLPSVSRPSVAVAAGATATVTVSYTAEAPITLNLRIDGLYLTQSTQTYGAAVPLVASRDAYLRVFVVANQNNTAKPRVRVRLSRSGAPTQTYTIEPPGNSTPTQVQEGVFGSSWNRRIPGSLIQPGLSIVADVDPAGAIDESNESDNRSPATGTKSVTVRAVPAARIRFVSVQQGTSAPGNVDNPSQLMDLARRMHPLNAVDVDVHPLVFSASAELQANGNGWSQVLSDLDALRVADGSDRTYFGVAKLTYGRQDGLVGLAFQEIPTALGWDNTGDASRVVAHELGHTWGRRHTACGGAPAETVDPLYPYANGQIGTTGLDVASGDLKPASSPDIMGYCFQNPWISDYNYQGVMSFRQSNAAAVRVTSAPRPSLLIWGRVINGQPVLEPAFHLVTRPSLPARPGPYSVTATAADGSQLFSLSFDAARTADGPPGNGHFAFAVPVDERGAAQLAGVRLSGPGGFVATSRPGAALRAGSVQQPVLRREGGTIVIQWNASAYRTIMVRDPDTGEVLAFARGGKARIWSAKDKLDVDLSDGVKSQRLRLAISRS